MHGRSRAQYKNPVTSPALIAAKNTKLTNYVGVCKALEGLRVKFHDEVFVDGVLVLADSSSNSDGNGNNGESKNEAEPEAEAAKEEEKEKLETKQKFDHRRSTLKLLNLISVILKVNCDYSSLFNFRREILEREVEIVGFVVKSTNEDEEYIKSLYNADLKLTEACLLKNPKSYPTWFHRKWTVNCLADGDEKDKQKQDLIQTELELTTKFLKLDERNFHCWNYRRFLIRLLIPEIDFDVDGDGDKGLSGIYSTQISNTSLSSSSSSSKPLTNLTQDTSKLLTQTTIDRIISEFEYTSELISRNFSNYSAYHYRSTLLGLLLAFTDSDNSIPSTSTSTVDHEDEDKGGEGESKGERVTVPTELTFTRNAIYCDPYDQSPWWYYNYLLGYVQSNPGSLEGLDLESEDDVNEGGSGTNSIGVGVGGGSGSSSNSKTDNKKKYFNLLMNESAFLREIIKLDEAEAEADLSMPMSVSKLSSSTSTSTSTSRPNSSSNLKQNKWPLLTLHTILTHIEVLLETVELKGDKSGVIEVLKIVDHDKICRYESMSL